MALAGWLCPDEAPLTWIICLTGNVIGIPIGIMASPHRAEASHFRVMGTWVATFVSGYVLSKLDVNASTFASDLQAGRALLFVAFLILGAVQTFVLRSYSDESRPQDYYVPEDRPAGPDSPAA